MVYQLRTAIDKAKANPNLLVAGYHKDMLVTRTDDELVTSISNKESEQLEYLGTIIYGNTTDVNENSNCGNYTKIILEFNKI